MFIFRFEILLRFGVPDNQILLPFGVPDNHILLHFGAPDKQILLYFDVPDNCSGLLLRGKAGAWQKVLLLKLRSTGAPSTK